MEDIDQVTPSINKPTAYVKLTLDVEAIYMPNIPDKTVEII
jgi:hypothetical protein